MTMPMERSYDFQYKSLLGLLSLSSCHEVNQRTGVGIVMLRGGCSIKLDLGAENPPRLPVPGNRAYFPKSAAAETAWQISGIQDAAFMDNHAPKLWEKFKEEDGSVLNAYGYRWRNHFNRDQLWEAVLTLRNNPTDRQVYISTWDPRVDGLGTSAKNTPCPVGFHLSISDYSGPYDGGRGKLHCSMFLRSSDVFVGLPYDIMNFSLLMDAIAATLGCDLGTLHVTLAHAHIYDPHFEALERSVDHKEYPWLKHTSPLLPRWTIPQIELHPDAYVASVYKASTELDVSTHPWNPRPKVVA